MCVGRYWTRDHRPKNARARHALRMVQAARAIVDFYNPPVFILENPRAKLRKMPVMQDLERRTVTYCQYGERRMKPTDLWGRFPPSLRLEPPCKNGDACHVAAPRGSTTGTQGTESTVAAEIPRLLALAVCLAAERDLLVAAA